MHWKPVLAYGILSSLSGCVAGAGIGGPVNTTSGMVMGQASGLRPDVSEYLGIRYAKPAKGDLRFAAPVPVDRAPGIFQATNYTTSDCPCNRIPMDNAALGGPAGEKLTIALSEWNRDLDEDCLSVNVWTKPQTGEKAKAVLFWIFGGGFTIGSGSSEVYDGSILADENDVVVVTFNYRTNIFGFPGAPGLPANVGLRDQRLALEWTRDNIARFGGDPSRITVFGQSAGGMSVDFVAFSKPEDPIAHALIAHSGVASSRVGISPKPADVLKGWYNATATTGCGGEEAGEATVACMRGKSQDELLKIVDSTGTAGVVGGFTPYGDGEVIPMDLAAQAKAGNFAKIPFMTGNTDREAGFFLITMLAYSNITAEQQAALPMELIEPLGDLMTTIAFTCPAADAANWRRLQGVPTWRYRYYGGNYANTEVNPVGSDYHTAELPVVFGTAPDVTGMPDDPIEAKAAAYMRDAWTTFAKDPKSGLKDKFHWPTYNPLTPSLIQLSLPGQTKAKYTFNWKTDMSCDLIAALLQGLQKGDTSSNLGSLGLGNLGNLGSLGNLGNLGSLGTLTGLGDLSGLFKGL